MAVRRSFYAETTRRHDLSTRKIHLIRYYRRAAIPTNRSIRTIRETLLRLVSIRLMHVVAHLYAFQVQFVNEPLSLNMKTIVRSLR